MNLHRTTFELSIPKKIEDKLEKQEMRKLSELRHKITNKCANVLGWVETLEQDRKEFKIEM